MDKLAIHGGKPVRDDLLPYGKQWLDEQDMLSIMEVLKGDFITQGPKNQEFENEVAKLVGAQYAVAFANGTAALHGACFAAGINPDDEVITTPLTFAASANCVLYQGGRPVFSDVNPDTYLLDLKQAEEKINSKTKAIIPVDYTGQPVNMEAYQQLASKHNLVLIQDAAHSFGASYDEKRVGSVADMTMFSFHPVKPVTTGEGGVIVTNNKYFYDKLLLFRTHGITREPSQLVEPDQGLWYYEMQDLGFNYRLTDFQAALGLSQMRHLDPFLNRRREMASLYQNAFAELEFEGLMKRPFVEPAAQSGWHLYVIQLQLERLSADRREIFDALRAENIGVHVHYIPVYHHPYYQKMGYEKGLCPTAEHIYERIITLPLFPRMSNKDVEDVIVAVKKVLRYYRMT